MGFFNKLYSGKDQRELRELVRYRKKPCWRTYKRTEPAPENAGKELILSCQEPYQTSMVKVLAVSWNISLPGSLLMDQKIAHNLKATKEQIVDDLNGVMSPLQRRMMKELLVHLDELNVHIKNLNDEIDNFMKPEKNRLQAIQDVTGIGNTSAQAIISVIGSDMSRFQRTGTFHLGQDCPGDNESAKRKIRQNQKKGMLSTDYINHL